MCDNNELIIVYETLQKVLTRLIDSNKIVV